MMLLGLISGNAVLSGRIVTDTCLQGHTQAQVYFVYFQIDTLLECKPS